MPMTEDEKKLRAKQRMQKLRSERKETETPEEKKERLNHQKEERARNRVAEREQKGLGPARNKAKPKSKQDYKISTTLAQNLDRAIRVKVALGGSGDDLDDFQDYLLNVNNVMEYLNNTYTNANTVKSYVSSIISVIKDIGDLEDDATDKSLKEYSVILTSLKKGIDKVVDKNQKTANEARNWVKWADIKKIKISSIEDDLDKIVFLLYTSIPPRRAEYRLLQKTDMPMAKMKLLRRNFVTTTKAKNVTKIVLGDYKTVDTYNRYIIPMGKSLQLKTLLKKYISDIPNGDYIFPPSYRHSAGWSKLVKDVFTRITGKKMTINLLRKSFSSHINELPANQRTQEKLKAYAIEMGTSVEQLTSSYMKINSDDSDDEDE